MRSSVFPLDMRMVVPKESHSSSLPKVIEFLNFGLPLMTPIKINVITPCSLGMFNFFLKVGEKDATNFTVAGKMERERKLSENPQLLTSSSRTPMIVTSSSSASPSVRPRSRSRSKTPTRTTSIRKPKSSPSSSSSSSQHDSMTETPSNDREYENRDNTKKTPKMRKFKGAVATPIPSSRRRPMSTPIIPKIVLPDYNEPSSNISRVQSQDPSSFTCEIVVPKLDEDSALDNFFKSSTFLDAPEKSDHQKKLSSITLDDLDFLKISPNAILSVPKKGVQMQKRNHR